jgi:1-acyl-sn-glycerol-3-phosphate acyltransferase
MKSYHSAVNKVHTSVRRFLEKAFNPFETTGPDLSKIGAPGDGVFVVSTHRSHADYFIMGTIMHERGVPNLRFAAGDNLTTMPIIGPAFTSWGAFTVARDNSLQRSYVRNLCEQVVGMLLDGDSILVFPEGGRSYGGGMMDIKSGITAAGILAQSRNPGRTIWFVPATVSYERTPELGFFPMVKAGKNLRKPGRNTIQRMIGSLLYFGGDLLPAALFFILPRFGFRYGSVNVDYGAPIKLTDLVDLEAHRDPKARDDFSAHRGTMQVLSGKLFDRLKALYRILPAHVVASALLDRGAQTVEQAVALCPEIVAGLKAAGRNCTTIEPLDTARLVALGAATLKAVGALRLHNGTFQIRKAWLVQYYASTLS